MAIELVLSVDHFHAESALADLRDGHISVSKSGVPASSGRRASEEPQNAPTKSSTRAARTPWRAHLGAADLDQSSLLLLLLDELLDLVIGGEAQDLLKLAR